MDFANGFEELRGTYAFEKITHGAGGESLKNQIAVLERSEDDAFARREERLQFGDAFDAALTRQVDVHEDDGRLDLWQFTQSVLGTSMGAEAAKPARIDVARQRIAQSVVVFDYGNGDFHGAARFKHALLCTVYARRT